MTTTIEDRVRKLIVEFIDPPEDFSNDTPFSQLGSDSLLMMELVMEVEDEFGLEIDDATIENLQTTNDLINYIQGQLNE